MLRNRELFQHHCIVEVVMVVMTQQRIVSRINYHEILQECRVWFFFIGSGFSFEDEPAPVSLRNCWISGSLSELFGAPSQTSKFSQVIGPSWSLRLYLQVLLCTFLNDRICPLAAVLDNVH